MWHDIKVSQMKMYSAQNDSVAGFVENKFIVLIVRT